MTSISVLSSFFSISFRQKVPVQVQYSSVHPSSLIGYSFNLLCVFFQCSFNQRTRYDARRTNEGLYCVYGDCENKIIRKDTIKV